VQTRLDSLRDIGAELMDHSTQITKCMRSIASLSETCAKIERALTDVMDQQSATDIVATIFNALDNVSDELLEETTVLLKRFVRHTEKIRYAYQTKWDAKITEYLSLDRVIGIRSEIGVLRIILEERLNRCTEETELVIHSPLILDNVKDIEELVMSCHRLEKAQGILLTDQEAGAFANELITIVGRFAAPAVLEKVANELERRNSESNSNSPAT